MPLRISFSSSSSKFSHDIPCMKSENVDSTIVSCFLATFFRKRVPHSKSCLLKTCFLMRLKKTRRVRGMLALDGCQRGKIRTAFKDVKLFWAKCCLQCFKPLLVQNSVNFICIILFIYICTVFQNSISAKIYFG